MSMRVDDQAKKISPAKLGNDHDGNTLSALVNVRHETEYPPLEHFLAVKSELAASGNWLHCLKRGGGDVWSTFKGHVYASKKYQLVYNISF